MGKHNRNSFFILGGALVGIGLSAWLSYLHFRLYTEFGYASFCGFGESFNCERVAASSLSVIFNLPLSGWAILAYIALLILAMFDVDNDENEQTIGTLTVLVSLMAAASILLAVLSIAVVKATCVLCTASHLLNLGLAALAWIEIKMRGGLRANLRSEIARFKRSPWIPGYLLGLLLIGIISGPFGLAPRYWSHAFFQHQAGIRHGFDDSGRAWIGAGHPEIVIHEYFDYGCPSCRLSHLILRKKLAKNRDRIRLVRHDFARMKCTPNNRELRSEQCALARGAFCAGKQGKVWEWNDAIIAGPKPLKGPARKTFETDLAAKLGLDVNQFKDCLFDSATIEYAQKQYLEAKENKISSTPMYIVDGEKLQPKELIEKL